MRGPRKLVAPIAALLVWLPLRPALAAEPVKQIGIYVQPYYEAARAAQGQPKVAVGQKFDALLASNRRQDVVGARDLVTAEPKLVTPMTMMVLAIRLYDVGLRDDAVFWFYAAKDRFISMADVLDVQRAGLLQAEDAVKNFATLAGPVINGYAFCDPVNQSVLRQKSLQWLESNPYEVMFLPGLAARPGDRRENFARALAKLMSDADKERAYFSSPSNVEAFRAARRQNQVDDKYCWK